MKALSIQQPWAHAILNLGKDVENRTWPTGVRGRILIHAGKKIDRDAIEELELESEAFPTGGIVGSVEIIDCVQTSGSEWFYGPFGFVLRNPIILPFMACRGQLGFFDVEYAVEGAKA